jgi:tetratricopeptide (TPR) repeat protein
LSRQGKWQEASKLLEEVLDSRKRVLGKEHLATLETMYSLANLLAAEGQFEDARQRFEETLQIQQSVYPGNPSTLRTMASLARMLATASDVKVRDPRRAVELANKLVEATPKEAGRWNTLGVASYRAGNYKNAITALEKSETLAPERYLAHNALFLAMAHWELGQREQARTCYDQAVAWMEKNRSGDPDLLQWRTEAARLLGIELADPPGKKDGK